VQVIKECATKKSPLKAGMRTSNSATKLSGRRLLGDDRLPLLSLYREFRNPAEIENLLLEDFSFLTGAYLCRAEKLKEVKT
jgi:hypothetical protein